ncbi:hypothetical protein KCV06_g38, partial [Aureobasidium melanogenum]
LSGDFALVVQVGLVAYEDDNDIGATLTADIVDPLAGNQTTKTLLSSSVPELGIVGSESKMSMQGNVECGIPLCSPRKTSLGYARQHVHVSIRTVMSYLNFFSGFV